jgi:hypothetical protein
MKEELIICLLLVVFTCSCTRLPISKYASSTEIKYQREQPSIHFSNKPLNIQGAWWWASLSRAMPDPNYMSTEVRRLFRPISKEHGKVLFAAFCKEQKKFFRDTGYVKVLKEDVRAKTSSRNEFYVTVLISNHAFNENDKRFQPKGRAQDFEFRLFEAVPFRKDNKWVIMQVVAAYRDRYYTFACIMDQTYAKNDQILKSQAALFFEDARIYLSEIAADS